MRNELDLDTIIDDYLQGKLNHDEVLAFEDLRKNNAAIDQKVVEQQAFLAVLKGFGHQEALKGKLNAIHETIDVDGLTEKYQPKQSVFISLWRKNRTVVAVAAMLLMLSVIALNLYKFSTQQDDVEQLSNRVREYKNSQDNLILNIKQSNTKPKINPGKYGGTGFALSANGYICTNFHVIKEADSIYVQNHAGESFKVEVAYSDAQNDIAILKIIDRKFTRLASLPYALKTNNISLGEVVYTLGFPKDDAVLGEGYVSSKTGAAGDSTAYQVALDVNPGNSGGPLLDNNGNIVGVISSRSTSANGAAFAIKSKYILDALRAIPSDSTTSRIAKVKKAKRSGLTRPRQIEKIQDHVFMVRVY